MKLIKQHLLATKAAVENVLYKSTDPLHDRVVVFGGTGAIKLPTGETAEQPSNPVDGMTRYNSSTDSIEYYAGGQWNTVRSVGASTVTKDTFTGDGSTTSFGPLSFSVADENSILVYIQNVWQNGGVNYTTSGNTINFTSAVPFGHAVVILHGFDTV